MCAVPIKVQYGNSDKVLETHDLLDNCSQDLGKTNKKSWCEGADDFNHNKDSQWRGHKQSNGGEGTQINKSQW